MSSDSDPDGSGPVPFPDHRERLVLEPDCARCPEPAAARECVAWGAGDPDASVFVVGEAPGTGDPDAERWQGGNWTGVAFTTRHSGRRIRRLLRTAGLLEDAFFTNAVKCLPPDGAGGAREPTEAERERCREHLERELAIVEPEVVVPAGKHATTSVFAMAGRDVEGFLESVLEVHDLDGVGPVVPVLHPSYRDVWASRLGFEDADAYEHAVSETFDSALQGDSTA